MVFWVALFLPSGVGMRFAFVSVVFFLFFIWHRPDWDASRVHGQLGVGYRERSFHGRQKLCLLMFLGVLFIMTG